MKKIGLFFGTNTAKTATIAKKIIAAFSDAEIESIAVEDATKKDFEKYDNIIAGASTWFDGELPSYWDETIPELDSVKMKLGLGDQVKYPDNFADGVGILANLFESKGATLVGATSVEGYNFEKSQAQQGDSFVGLIIDYENQHSNTARRIEDWVKQLKKEFS